MLIFPAVAFPQVKKLQLNFTPSPIADTVPPGIYMELRAKKDALVSQHPELDKSVRNSLQKFANDRFKKVVKMFNGDNFITEGPLKDYLADVLGTVTRANPGWKNDAFVLAYRSNSPNAFSTQEGLVALNLGLVSRLENTGEVAYVLCHELAHYYLLHAENEVVALSKLDNDPELKGQIKAVRKNQYQQYTQMKAVMEDLNLSVNRHSRGHEFEADSLGFIMFEKAGYDSRDAIRLLEILDSVDAPEFKKNIDLKKHFDFADYPIKPAWLAYSPLTMWHVKKTDAKFGDSDTLKTHPNIKRRIRTLKRIAAFTALHESLSRRDSAMSYFSRYADFDEVESDFHARNYGRSLFAALELLNYFPANTYLHAMVGGNLYQVYQSQKNHLLGNTVALPDERFEENYNRILFFLHELRLAEVALVAYHYVTTSPEKDFDDERFLYTFWLTSTLPGSAMDPGSVKETYLEKFPQGKYKAKF